MANLKRVSTFVITEKALGRNFWYSGLCTYTKEKNNSDRQYAVTFYFSMISTQGYRQTIASFKTRLIDYLMVQLNYKQLPTVF